MAHTHDCGTGARSKALPRAETRLLRWSRLGIVLLFALGFAVIFTFVVVMRRAPTPVIEVAGAGAVLTFAAALALGIERFIEGLWVAVGLVSDTIWPLTRVRSGVTNTLLDFDSTFAALFARTQSQLDLPAQRDSAAAGGLAAHEELQQLQACVERAISSWRAATVTSPPCCRRCSWSHAEWRRWCRRRS